MSRSKPLLFTPISFRNLELKNRVIVSPMCQYSSNEGCVSDWHMMHLGQFAVGGAGLLIVEMTNVESRGRISPHCVGLYNDKNEDALKRVVEFCKTVRQHADWSSACARRSQGINSAAVATAYICNASGGRLDTCGTIGHSSD